MDLDMSVVCASLYTELSKYEIGSSKQAWSEIPSKIHTTKGVLGIQLCTSFTTLVQKQMHSPT